MAYPLGLTFADPPSRGDAAASLESACVNDGVNGYGSYSAVGYTSLANDRPRSEGHVKRNRSIRTKVSELSK